MKQLLFFLFVFILFVVFVKPTIATDQTYCNACGYCLSMMEDPLLPNTTQRTCMNCIYPTEMPLVNTFNIIGDTPPQPLAGKHYTMIGCIDLGSGVGGDVGRAGGIARVILDLIFKLAGAIAFLYIIYGAFLILTSQGDPERLNYGKQIVFRSIIGLIVCLLSVFLISFITLGVLKIPGVTPEP